MHTHNLEQWQHSHDFSVDYGNAEKNTQKVMLLTTVTMVVEVVAGTVFGSLALLADGWHMATHVAAFGLTIFAYRYARRFANSPKYTFGTGKVSSLGGFSSAVALGVIALLIAIESISRFFHPQTIHFNEAIAVAAIGLVVNLASGFLLHEHHDHSHAHNHDHDHDHEHHHEHDHTLRDHNLQAAYFHVLADALTSVFAIVALLAGKFFGWNWLDPMMGLVGTVVIMHWARGLLRETSTVLLDGSVDRELKASVVAAIEADSDTRIVDLHLWYVSQRHLSAIISLVTHEPKPPEHYKHLIANIVPLAHVVVEVNACSEQSCLLNIRRVN